jgi:hypothetical protein
VTEPMALLQSKFSQSRGALSDPLSNRITREHIVQDSAP